MQPLILAVYSRFHIDQFLSTIYLFALGILCLALAALATSGLIRQSNDLPVNAETAAIKSEVICKNSLDYEKIGEGPLVLKGHHTDPLAAALNTQLLILGRNTRPDVQQTEQALLIGIKGSDEQLLIYNEQAFYLNLDPVAEMRWQVGGFSSTPTSCKIKAQILDSNSILMEAQMNEGSDGGKRVEFILSKQSDYTESKASNEEVPYFLALKKAQFWGQDLFIKQYAGPKLQFLKNKHRIEIYDGASSYVYMVQEKDYLMWENGQWRLVEKQHLAKVNPIALITSVSSEYMEIEAWDESGFHSFHAKIPLKKDVKFLRSEDLLTAAHLRTTKQITCLLGKRRMILKQGDWLIKTASGWRPLRTLDEVEAYLTYNLRGELFIFDQIVQESGKFFIRGNLFDEMHTQKQSISIAISSEKKINSSTKKVKKKPLFSKL